MPDHKYRVFRAIWYKDSKNTIPCDTPRRKTTIQSGLTIDQARAICKDHNFDAAGNRIKRPYGSAFEFEVVA